MIEEFEGRTHKYFYFRHLFRSSIVMGQIGEEEGNDDGASRKDIIPFPLTPAKLEMVKKCWYKINVVLLLWRSFTLNFLQHSTKTTTYVVTGNMN